MAAKKKASAKRPVKKAAAKRPAKKSAKKAVSKSVKRPAKKAAAKRPVKKAAKRVAAKKTSVKADATKVVIPPVPTRSATTVTSAPKAAPATPSSAPAPAQKSSNGVLFLVIAGVVLLAIFALTNSSKNDSATPKPSASESMSEKPTAKPSQSASESTATLTYEAPQGFVAIANDKGGVTLRWKAPAATEGLTGYAISVSYNAVDFTEVTTVGADQFSFEITKAGEEGGTQFLLQSVYSDGTKKDAKKFSLRGKYQN